MKVLRNILIVLFVLFWALNSVAQSFHEKGVGEWHKLPFADVRLLSCTTGTLDRNLLVGGLQIKVHPGWILKKPTLKTLSKNGVLDYPIRPDPVDTTLYTGTILLPIVYNMQLETELNFGVEGNLIGCWDDNCFDLPIHVEIPLDNTESNYTSYCAYIMDEMGQTPKLDIQMGMGQYIDDHTALLQFHVPDVRQAFLQNQNGYHFKVLEAQFWPDDVQFKVSYPEEWSNGMGQDWILITNQGAFRVPIRLTEKPLPPVNQEKPWGLFLLSGILLFVCSPFFILLGISFPRTAQLVRRQCVQAMIVGAVLTIGTCLTMVYFPDLGSEKIIPYILIIMGITLIFPPRFVWWAGLLFIVWPKPYLLQMLRQFPLYYFLPWLVLCQIIPFALLYRYAEFWGKKARWSLKRGFFSHNLFFLLPAIIMLLYGIYDAQLKVPYQTVIAQDTNQPILICEKDDCISWIENGLNIYFVDADSSLGKTLLDLYQASKNLLIFDDDGIRTILTDTTPRNLKGYLIGLKNYRAGYRPTDPLVHSEDDPHAPLPNAR